MLIGFQYSAFSGQTLEVCPHRMNAEALLAIRMPLSTKQASACSPASLGISAFAHFSAIPIFRITLLYLGDAPQGIDRWHAATKHLGFPSSAKPPGSFGYLSEVHSGTFHARNAPYTGVVPLQGSYLQAGYHKKSYLSSPKEDHSEVCTQPFWHEFVQLSVLSFTGSLPAYHASSAAILESLFPTLGIRTPFQQIIKP